jgi:hypothetical protein
MAPIRPGQRVSPWRQPAYRIGHELLSAADRVWYRRSFDEVERFCLFAGYARSGHSIVGAVLDAHREAVIAHELEVTALVLAGVGREELYARLIARSQWFRWYKGSTSNYDYRIHGGWQGRFARLRVIGDKRGGSAVRTLAEHPDFIDRLSRVVGVPVHVVHVVRNPYDNIAAMSIWHQMTVDEATDHYFSHHDTTSRLNELCGEGRVCTVHHERFVADPAGEIAGLCRFLGLEPYPGYLEACRARVFRAPTYTRLKVPWTAAQVRRVEELSRPHAFLREYGFEPEGMEAV